MTNLDTVIETLAAHREARRWSDEAVAADVLARLGLDPAAEQGVVEHHEAPVEAPVDAVPPQHDVDAHVDAPHE